ncbi:MULTISPECIES: ABC transporter substrate-binding protein [unclassified Massilia]|uniref:ABC transporter substrate-binding protein n=1 Tax=unclassified Massilia TaxID=2609279 RepID=UPI00068E91DC|nr:MULTISPECIES: ABC transporter substrate-binding protein [unclassified Massilia]AWG45837.1 hypothetical protein AM586_16175 [Massilia sp. WG5]
MHIFPHGLRCAAVLAAFLLLGPGLAGAPASAAAPAGDAAAGERIYREGLTRDGRPVRGMGLNGAVLTGQEAACSQCHRRSGFGTAEGAFVVRPITANDLFQERAPAAPTPRIAHQIGKPQRPPYDERSLAAAVRSGIDVNGRPLGGLMPHYPLGPADMRDLGAYLHVLGATPPEGVDGEDVHLATVIQPGVAPARRAALLAVLDAFIRDKNAAVRSEPARRNAGAMRMQRAYRRWVPHVWQLEGAPAQWGGQLERLYRTQPVFALVSGLGDQDWTPVHAFGERRKLPCILPQTLLPASALPNAYTIYFSDGIRLEAEGIAQQLAAQHARGRVTQVYRAGDPLAQAAADALRRALAAGGVEVADQVLAAQPAAGQRPGRDGDAATVLWLDGHGLEGLTPPPDRPLYLAGSLAPAPPPSWQRAVLVSRWDSGPEHERRVRRARDWLKARAIFAGEEEEVQVDALFALSMVGEAMMHMLDSFSREYFLELVEHSINVTVLPSMHPHLSLGRDMRVAAHEVYVGGAVEPVSASVAAASP